MVAPCRGDGGLNEIPERKGSTGSRRRRRDDVRSKQQQRRQTARAITRASLLATIGSHLGGPGCLKYLPTPKGHRVESVVHAVVPRPECAPRNRAQLARKGKNSVQSRVEQSSGGNRRKSDASGRSRGARR